LLRNLPITLWHLVRGQSHFPRTKIELRIWSETSSQFRLIQEQPRPEGAETRQPRAPPWGAGSSRNIPRSNGPSPSCLAVTARWALCHVGWRLHYQGVALGCRVSAPSGHHSRNREVICVQILSYFSIPIAFPQDIDRSAPPHGDTGPRTSSATA